MFSLTLYDLFRVEYGKFWLGHVSIGRTASDGLASAPTSIYMRVSLTFKRNMTLYGTMVYFISLVLKSMVLSYTPDSEHILEIAMCSKNKQSLYEVFHLQEKDYIRDAYAT